MPPPNESDLPASLLAAFKGGPSEALVSFLRFISPVTTASVHAM
jgi:hypothetical protein